MDITIIVDNREKKSGIPDILFKKGIPVVLKQLAAGDYIIGGDIIIERKTKTDFVQSIINGHIFNQCARLRKTGLIPLFIVEGNPYDTTHRINREAIKGALLAISLSWQIPVIRSSGKEDTVHLIIMAAKQQLNTPVFIRKKGKKPKHFQNQQHYLVQTIPGIGSSLTIRLIDHFSNIERIVLADIDALMKVEGVGKTKAKKIFEFFRVEKLNRK
ncbi:MAG: helix-hairpin-helix domain-containing protein [Bacteroidales bacterium]|jgi:DNA excision repair protein ERCC-4|nr:helix-hairpin-helix domain-containing protein [Bacteroidales bacterium]